MKFSAKFGSLIAFGILTMVAIPSVALADEAKNHYADRLQSLLTQLKETNQKLESTDKALDEELNKSNALTDQDLVKVAKAMYRPYSELSDEKVLKQYKVLHPKEGIQWIKTTAIYKHLQKTQPELFVSEHSKKVDRLFNEHLALEAKRDGIKKELSAAQSELKSDLISTVKVLIKNIQVAHRAPAVEGASSASQEVDKHSKPASSESTSTQPSTRAAD